MFALLVLSAAIGGGSGVPVTVNVDAIERNTCYYDDGTDCFAQFILWEWLPYLSQHGVVAWAMVGDSRPPVERGGYWHLDLEHNGQIYRIRSKSYVETRTHQSQDPERLNLYVWPANLRRGLK